MGIIINIGMKMGRLLLVPVAISFAISPYVYKFEYICKGKVSQCSYRLAAVSCSIRVYFAAHNINVAVWLLVMGILWQAHCGPL